MNFPKYNLLYFKCLLDIAFIEFFKEYNDQFAKQNGKYVLCNSLSKQNISNFILKSILRQLKTIVQPYDLVDSPNYYFVIGACQPKDNFLLNYKDKSFPKKLSKLIYGKFQLKYLLKEKDIEVDIVKFNEACCDVFNQLFLHSEKYVKYGNLVFLTHKNLDCYSLFKVLKCIFGKSNCINIKQNLFSDLPSPIVAVNDLIDRNIHDKIAANRDRRFKKIYEEIKQYVQLNTSIESK